jgi:hypothetical protein
MNSMYVFTKKKYTSIYPLSRIHNTSFVSAYFGLDKRKYLENIYDGVRSSLRGAPSPVAFVCNVTLQTQALNSERGEPSVTMRTL